MKDKLWYSHKKNNTSISWKNKTSNDSLKDIDVSGTQNQTQDSVIRSRKELFFSKREGFHHRNSKVLGTDVSKKDEPLIPEKTDIDFLYIRIEEKIKKYEQLFLNLRTEWIQTKANEIKKQMSHLFSETYENFNTIQKKIEALDETTKHTEQSKFQLKNIRDNYRQSVVSKLEKKVILFNKLHNEYQLYQDKEIDRVVNIVYRDLNEEQKINLKKEIMNGEKSAMVFGHNFISQDHSTASTRLNRYNEMAKEVLSMEQQIKAIKQMFIDISILLKYQSELIDNIEHNVSKSQGHIDKGNIQLAQAVERSDKSGFCVLF